MKIIHYQFKKEKDLYKKLIELPKIIYETEIFDKLKNILFQISSIGRYSLNLKCSLYSNISLLIEIKNIESSFYFINMITISKLFKGINEIKLFFHEQEDYCNSLQLITIRKGNRNENNERTIEKMESLSRRL